MPRRRAARISVATGVAVLVLGALATAARAQDVVDGSDAVIGAADTRAVLALVAERLRAADARVSALRRGRAGAVCGAVETRNRMGSYTGPRGFVAILGEGFIGRLPEGPEQRNPAGMAEFQAMERARALFAQNCAGA